MNKESWFPEKAESNSGCTETKIIPVDSLNLPQAAEVHSISWKESHRSFCSADFIEMHSPRRQEEYLRRKMENGSRLYMLVENRPVGIVSVTGSLIEDLYILPEKQNMGFGTELLRYAMDQCEGDPVLWILENNKDAERLYRRLGFEFTGRRNPITDGLDEIELALKRSE